MILGLVHFDFLCIKVTQPKRKIKGRELYIEKKNDILQIFVNQIIS